MSINYIRTLSREWLVFFFFEFTPKTRNCVLGSTRLVRAIDQSSPLLHQI